MYPKTRELADTSQFSRRTVREAADCLPEDDAVLDAAIGEAVGRCDIMVFFLLIKAVHGKTHPAEGGKNQNSQAGGDALS